jgi:hypothetical protein
MYPGAGGEVLDGVLDGGGVRVWERSGFTLGLTGRIGHYL